MPTIVSGVRKLNEIIENVYVTVIMSVYNDENNLSIAIESILNQSHENTILFIVDDGSTDGTRNIIHNYSKKYSNIRCLYNDQNLGLASCLNQALKLVDTEYIARMDSDDFSYPDRLHKQLKYMIENPHIEVLGTSADFIDSNGSLMTIIKPTSFQEIKKNIEFVNPFVHSSVMMRKTFIDNIGGYDNKLRKAQDLDLWYRGISNNNYANLPDVLVRYSLKKQNIYLLLYGFRVRVINAWRRKRFFIGLTKAILVLIHGLYKSIR